MPLHTYDRDPDDLAERRRPTLPGQIELAETAAPPIQHQGQMAHPGAHPVLAVQLRYGNRAAGRMAAQLARGGENRTGLPDRLKTGLESLSGLALDDVRVHYNSPKPAELQALAYTQGQDIYVAPGQERHLPHEAWHVVQQMQGRVRPTQRVAGEPVNADERLEQEATRMGARALQVPLPEASDPAGPSIRPVSYSSFPTVVQKFDWTDIASLAPQAALAYVASAFGGFGVLASLAIGLVTPYLVGLLFSFIKNPPEREDVDEQIAGQGTGAEHLFSAAMLIAEKFRSKATLAIGKVGSEWVVASQANTVPPEIRVAMKVFGIKSISGITTQQGKPVSKAHIHAEMKILGYADQQGAKVSWIYLSRKPCPGCLADLHANGIHVENLLPGPQPQLERSNYREYGYQAS